MAETTPAAIDRDILLDAVVQRLKAAKPTAGLGGRIENAVEMLRKMERSTSIWEDDSEGREEFLREVRSAAKILADRRPSSLAGLRGEWDTLTNLVRSILETAPPRPKREEYIERALRQVAREWLNLEARPSFLRHARQHTKDNPRGVALQLLWQGRVNPDDYQDPESLRRALKRVTPEAPW